MAALAHNAEHKEEIVLGRLLLDTLRAIPGVEAALAPATRSQADHGYDFRVEARFAGRPLTLLVEAKSVVYPRDVRQLLWKLRALASQPSPAENVHLIAAASLSTGAKDLLRAEGTSYFDSGGSLYLSAPGAYVYIEKPPPKVEAARMRSLFSGRRAQVVHALLMERDQWVDVKGVAERSQVSPATASEVLSEVEMLDWIEVRGRGPRKERLLRDPRALLDAWARDVAASRPPMLQRYFVPGAKADGLMDRVAGALDGSGVHYAMTYEAAAQRYAPFLTTAGQVRCRVPASDALTATLRELGARPVREGANLAIMEVKTLGELLFRQRVGQAWLASPVHVYLDLLRGEGRSKELAQHVREERIGF